MILAAVSLLLSLFGLGGGTAALEHAIEANMKDSSRREPVLDLVDQIMSVIEGYSDALRDPTDRQAELNDHYASTRAQYDRVLSEVRSESQRTRSQLLDLRFQMKDRMTREEWAAVYPLSDGAGS